MLRGGCGRAPPRRPSAPPWRRLQSGSYGPPGPAKPQRRPPAERAVPGPRPLPQRGTKPGRGGPPGCKAGFRDARRGILVRPTHGGTCKNSLARE
eukprot:230901-Chlamydomonas_euryale.AAC.1